MWKVFEPWQLRQLHRLAELDPERSETILNTLWNQFPGLFEDVIVMAVDQGEIGIDRAAEVAGVTAAEIEARLQVMRRQESLLDRMVTVDETNVARLEDGKVAVWEIVRELRKLGSLERLESAFPSLHRTEIAAALKYAQSHPTEIEDQISRYEEAMSRRRAVYPSLG